MNPRSLKKKIIYFWKTDNEKISIVRDILVALILVLILLTALWTYTGQWFGAPMVAIESGSMEHLDSPFGKLGTIDAGDMVLLVKVNGKDDIVTNGGTCGGASYNKDKDYYFYGNYGDVIVYQKYGNPNEKQIIHRAMCWVEMNSDGTYTVPEYCIVDEESITIKSLGINDYKPSHSGFITKGDNPVTNTQADQVGGICSEPIKPEWITGKARSEIPWIGTINLLFDDIITGKLFTPQATIYNVSEDCIFMLIIVIAILISIPVSLDIYDWYKSKNK